MKWISQTVDAAEDNQEVCHKVNAEGTENIARICGKLDIPMVYISTDYVFDGQGTRPWEPDDPVVKPLNVYGQAKYDGEVAVEKYAPKHYIVRMMTRSEHLLILMILRDFWWICSKKKSMVNIMQQMKVDTFPGVILQKKFSVRQVWM